MNWGLELSPKTDGFMALARSSPSVDFVCRRVRNRKRESDGKRRIGGDRKKKQKGSEERGKQRLKFYTPTFERCFAIQSRVYYWSVLSDVCRITASKLK